VNDDAMKVALAEWLLSPSGASLTTATVGETKLVWEAAWGARQAEVARLREALAFAASVIKSGESWTTTCEEMIGGALRHEK
jgi:hypothetical protein